MVCCPQIIQFVAIRANRILLFGQRLVSNQYFDSTYSFTAPSVPLDMYNPLKAHYRTTLDTDYKDMLIEYDAML